MEYVPVHTLFGHQASPPQMVPVGELILSLSDLTNTAAGRKPEHINRSVGASKGCHESSERVVSYL